MPQIERISACPPERFWRDYVLPRRPVILTDLIADFPHRSPEALVAALADHELVDVHGAPLATLASWWATVQRSAHDASARAQLGEIERALATGGYSSRHTSTDIRVAASFFASASQLHALHEALQTPLDRDLLARGLGPGGANTVMLFLGHPGVTTPCHVDGWVAQTFNTQLAGTKEWFLAPPEASAALGPVGFTFLVDPMRMPARERALLADTVRGYSFTIEPGETLYFPHQWVHGTFYPEASFSFVQHFGRDLTSMFVSREIHRGFLRHAVMQVLYPQLAVEQQHWDSFLALHDACKREYATPRERFSAIDGILRGLFERFHPAHTALTCEVETVQPLDEARAVAWYENLDGARTAWTNATGKPLFDWWR
jgi:hypothetical protein